MKVAYVCLVLLIALIAFATADHNKQVETFFDFRDDERLNIDPIQLPEFASPRDALRHFFSGPHEENMALLKHAMTAAQKDSRFATHLESTVQLQFSMNVEDFTVQYDAARNKLMKLADAMGIEYNMFTTSYAELLAQCTNNIASYPGLITVLMECDEEKDLFATSYTLLGFGEEQTMLRGVLHLDKPITWAFNKIKSNKCSWCTKIAGYVVGKACDKGAELVCDAVIVAITEGSMAPFAGKICGSPINLASWFSKACKKMVEWIGSKTMTAKQICQKVPLPSFTIPAHNGAIFEYSSHTLSLGTAC